MRKKPRKFIPMPKKFWYKFYNACTDFCDMVYGPCACGAGHTIDEWPKEVQKAIGPALTSQKRGFKWITLIINLIKRI